MVLETRKRREHLTKEDLQKNKALLENFATGNTQYLEEQNGKPFSSRYSFHFYMGVWQCYIHMFSHT